jgi:hypothetical protein
MSVDNHQIEKRRLNILKGRFAADGDPPVSENDTQFQENVTHSHQEKLELLNRVKQVPKLDKLNGSYNVKAHIITNDKLPLKLKRDDVFDIILANYKLDQQIQESRDLLLSLRQKENVLMESIKDQQKLNSGLLYIKDNIKDREVIEADEETQPDMTEQIRQEKLRYRKLRQILKGLVAQYEPEVPGVDNIHENV